MKKVHFTCFILLFVFYYSFNAQVKGLYVDKFNLILGNVQKEDSLLNYAQGNGFNYLALYNLWNVHTTSSLTNTVSAQPLANFINKAKTMFGITAVGATGESYWFFSNVIHVYNQQHSNPNHKFDVYNLEFEFWITSSVNSGGIYCTTYLQPQGFSCDTSGAFKFYKRELRRMDSLANTIGVISETYIGWPNSGQAKYIAKSSDRVLVHAYVANESTTYTYTRPRLIDLSGSTVPLKFMPIFSAESIFMGPWSASNQPVQAYNNYALNFANETGTWKTNAVLLGYQWFAYSFMPKNSSLSIQEISNRNESLLFPNPTNGILYLKENKFKNPTAPVLIYNTLGQIIREMTFSEKVDMSEFDPGIYYIKTEEKYTRIVLQK